MLWKVIICISALCLSAALAEDIKKVSLGAPNKNLLLHAKILPHKLAEEFCRDEARANETSDSLKLRGHLIAMQNHRQLEFIMSKFKSETDEIVWTGGILTKIERLVHNVPFVIHWIGESITGSALIDRHFAQLINSMRPRERRCIALSLKTGHNLLLPCEQPQKFICLSLPITQLHEDVLKKPIETPDAPKVDGVAPPLTDGVDAPKVDGVVPPKVTPDTVVPPAHVDPVLPTVD